MATALVLAAAALDAGAGRGGWVPRVLAQEDWFLEFEEICSKTQDAMSLSSEDLRALIGRCEKLAPRIEALDPSRRKVYTRRLQVCRDLYQFVLDTREPR